MDDSKAIPDITDHLVISGAYVTQNGEYICATSTRLTQDSAVGKYVFVALKETLYTCEVMRRKRRDDVLDMVMKIIHQKPFYNYPETDADIQKRNVATKLEVDRFWQIAQTKLA